ncbi:hypothetical protein KY362_05080 [Candidatus Woesearchaeota archaeon]|nr:hypothetical protein [Candidatus Woesearchaeota archaeon]
MRPTTVEGKVHSLKRIIMLLAWDLEQIKDIALLNRETRHLNSLRSGLRDTHVRSEDS